MAAYQKIPVKNVIVELDGDEMTRVMWGMVKDSLLFPYLEMNTDYYDLSLENRDRTNDEITHEAAAAIKKHKVGVKCATITANVERVEEYGLKRSWRSPNATLRALLDGTVFRVPIMVKNIKPMVSSWKKPIVVGRHAYGDVYSAVELPVTRAGKAELVFTPTDGGASSHLTIHDFTGPGILQGVHNTAASIAGFAKTCFAYAYDNRIDLWFSIKDTISKVYDAYFREVFEEEYKTNWQDKFNAAGLGYYFYLIDDAVARLVRSSGGFLWALKNYDGDVMSDLIASANGSLAMMSSVLVSPMGCFEYEAAHGTVQKHYYKHLRGEETSSNAMALIFAWTGALKKRAELDSTPAVFIFAQNLETAAKETIESGVMTGDLLLLADHSPDNRLVNTQEFIKTIAKRLEIKLKLH